MSRIADARTRFAYGEATAYRPAGQEIGTAAQFTRVLDAYGVRHALLVGPNSGYEQDNRCLLDAIANGEGRFKGIAVVPNNVEDRQLERLRAAGIIGVAFNATLHGAAPDAGDRRRVLWETPCRVLGFPCR